MEKCRLTELKGLEWGMPNIGILLGCGLKVGVKQSTHQYVKRPFLYYNSIRIYALDLEATLRVANPERRRPGEVAHNRKKNF